MGSWANVGAEFVEIFGRKDWRFASDKRHWRDERAGKFYWAENWFDGCEYFGGQLEYSYCWCDG